MTSNTTKAKGIRKSASKLRKEELSEFWKEYNRRQQKRERERSAFLAMFTVGATSENEEPSSFSAIISGRGTIVIR